MRCQDRDRFMHQSHGEVQSGIKERLSGLTYSINEEGLAADPLIIDWIEEEIQRLIGERCLS